MLVNDNHKSLPDNDYKRMPGLYQTRVVGGWYNVGTHSYGYVHMQVEPSTSSSDGVGALFSLMTALQLGTHQTGGWSLTGKTPGTIYTSISHLQTIHPSFWGSLSRTSTLRRLRIITMLIRRNVYLHEYRTRYNQIRAGHTPRFQDARHRLVRAMRTSVDEAGSALIPSAACSQLASDPHDEPGVRSSPPTGKHPSSAPSTGTAA